MTEPPAVPAMPDVAGLRILAFCDWYSPDASGGAERAAWQIYRRLGAAGAEILVVSAAHGAPHEDPGVTVRVVKGWDLSGLAGAYFAPAPEAFLVARRELDRWKPSVVHVNTIHYTGCVAGAYVARRRGVPLVTTMQLGPVDHLPRLARAVAGAYERTVGRYVLGRSMRVLAVSEAVRRHAVALGAAPDRVAVVHNGVDHEQFAAPPLVPQHEPHIVFVGRLVQNKGPDLLVEAALRLRERGYRFRVTFYGDGPLRAELAAKVAAAEATSQIAFAGQVDDIPDRLTDAEIVVRASYTEGLPLAVIEAMAAGRCNVVSDIEPNRELVRDGVTGRVFRVGDATDLARTLAELLDRPEERSRLGEAARREAARYSWDRMAALHGQVVAELALAPRSVQRHART